MFRAGGRRAVLLGACLVLCGLALAGCREDEQGRELFFEAGTYPRGEKPGPGLTEETVQNLQQRAQTQQF
jgi:hypothetical protein